jgi:8-oxo-dGTP pyrophosphatase MutT (NUDIX family)
MEIVLRDSDIPGIETLAHTDTSARRRFRESVRAVAYDPESGSIVLIYSSHYDRYEVPGGSMEEGETPEETLRRELAEEAGVTEYEIVTPLSDIREHYGRIFAGDENVEHLHHAWFIRITGPIGSPSLTEFETEKGFTPVLVPAELALDIMDEGRGDTYG